MLLGIVFLVPVVAISWPPGEPAHFISRDNCAKLPHGATQAEVVRILGVPPGYYNTRPHQPVFYSIAGTCTGTSSQENVYDQYHYVSWCTDEIMFLAWFDRREDRLWKRDIIDLRPGTSPLVIVKFRLSRLLKI